MTGAALLGPGPAGARLLVNASERDDVYVLVRGKPRRLPRVPPPLIVDRRDGRGSDAVFAVDRAGATATLEVHGAPVVDVVVGPLPVLDGVVYLVDPEARLRFAGRSDLVVAETFQVWQSSRLVKELRKARTRKQRLKARRRELKRVPHAKRFVLASVSFAAPSVAGVDAPGLAR